MKTARKQAEESGYRIEAEFVERASAPISATAPLTIRFEDYGQDFLEWDVDKASHQIIDCRPFQASVWCGKYLVFMECLKVGQRVDIADIPPEEFTNETDFLTVYYPIESLKNHTYRI